MIKVKDIYLLRKLKIIITGIIIVLSYAGLVSAQRSEYFAAVPNNDDFIATQVFNKLGQRYVPSEVLVRFKKSTPRVTGNSIHNQMSSTLLEKVPGGIERARIKEGLIVEEAVEEYMNNPEVEHAQPNFIKHLYVIPSDTSFNTLWGLHNTGQTVNGLTGTYDADIDAPEAWDISTGSDTVVVAVIDSGVDYNHPDLSANMWSNPGETNCSDGVDNDGNSYIDDCNGWDFWANDNDPADYNNHGTHVAGIIGSVGNNSTGVTGVNWTTKIMALRAIGVIGVITTSAEISAINYAVANGAKVINASYGGPDFDQFEHDAIRAAGDAGVLFIAAAGNGGDDRIGDNNDTDTDYPSGYNLPNIIAVAATDQNDVLAGFSNYGPTSVDVAAPGTNIFSTLPTIGYTSPITVYSTNFDSDVPGFPPANWGSSGTNNSWAVNNALAYSSPNSLEDSPGGNYLNNTSSIAFSTPIISVKDNRYTLNFRIRANLESNFDFLLLLGSENQSDWELIDSRTGYSGSFISDSEDYTILADLFSPNFYVGFGLLSDNSITRDGVYIDNVLLTRAPMFISSHTYQYFEGTSMAAPYVSGLAALIWSQRPHLTATDVKSLILNSVDIKSSLTGRVLTGGRINAFNALCTDSSPSIPELVYPTRCETDLSTTVTFEWTPYIDPDGDTVRYDLYYCDDPSFAGCTPVAVLASIKNNSTSFAGIGSEGLLLSGGLLLFGIIATGSIKGRKKILVLMLILIVTGIFIVSCGSGGGGGGSSGESVSPPRTNITQTISGFNSNTRYHWKVTADDGQNIYESEIKSFTTGS